MPTLNLGRVGFVNKGTWLISTAYKINDTVTYLGGTYAALQANTGQTPILGGTVYWQEWVANDVVHKSGDETIADVKTFTSSPIIPDGDSAFEPLTFGQFSAKLASDIHSSTSKTTPVDADEFALSDSAATFGLKKLTFVNLKSAINTTITSKIQPITASVAANDLTVTLNATSLDFRSATLGSGTVNTRSIASPISLVVPSTATLGTISAISSRLVIVAIDNAGIVELAITNLSGGLNLDETTLTSTTAMSITADIANGIYSTTARASVPFRVVGFIDITESTAGVWATAPSTIQGVGGQALASMSSLGYGQTWQDVTGSRALTTTYYNTTGKPIEVIISWNSTAGGAVITVAGISIITSATTGSNSDISTFIVPNGATYVASGANGIIRWSELR